MNVENVCLLSVERYVGCWRWILYPSLSVSAVQEGGPSGQDASAGGRLSSSLKGLFARHSPGTHKFKVFWLPCCGLS